MPSSLRLIFWEATRACNLECPHCRAQAEKKRSPEELTTQEAKRFLKTAASFSKPIIVFSGGEALLREDIYELIRYANQLGLKSALATNASLISLDTAMRLKENKTALVAVSIYGSNAKSHDKFCGAPGAFEKTLAGINNLKKAGIPLQINTTITKKNLAELEAMGNFAGEQGAVAYHVFFLVPVGRGKSLEGDEISAREYEEAFNRLYDFQSRAPIRIKATCAPHYYRVLRQRLAKEKKKLPSGSDNFSAITKGCLAGQGVCFVSYKGEVFGCGYLPVKAGDLRKEDFKSIWFESKLFQDLRDSSKLKGRCGTCEFKLVCGGCRARAYWRSGDFQEEEPYCVYQPQTSK
jgi:heme b synthase